MKVTLRWLENEEKDAYNGLFIGLCSGSIVGTAQNK